MANATHSLFLITTTYTIYQISVKNKATPVILVDKNVFLTIKGQF